jgi:hypothetical protein
MYDIPQRLKHVNKVKTDIKVQLDRTGQDTNVTFREYPNLIRNIPNAGVLNPEDLSKFVEQTININGEKA